MLFAPGQASPADADSLSHLLDKQPDDTAKVSHLLAAAQQYRKYYSSRKLDNRFLQQALSLSERLNYTYGLAAAYNMMGVAKRERSNYLLAADYGQIALTYAQKLKDSSLLANIYNNIGVAYRRLDENQKAFEHHFAALKIAENIGDLRNVAIATNSIGNIQLALWNYEKAIDQFERSLQIERKRNNDLGIAINYGNLGLAYEGLKQYDKAIDYYERSLSYNKKISSENGIVICYNSLGGVYEKTGNYNKALDYLQMALAVNGQINDKIDVANSYISIGKLYIKKKDFTQAESNIRDGLVIALQIKSKSMAMEAYQALGELYRIRGNFEGSLEMMSKSLNYKDSIINEKSAARLDELEVLYDLDRKNNRIKLLEQENRIGQLQSNRNWTLVLALLVFVVLLIIGGFLYIRQRNFKSHKRALQLELQSLRSQMNPHFIFNSLNSIHKYIWSNQAEEASDYLTKFSRLIRMILENTRQASISLSKELQFLSLYLELESLRCNYKFSYLIQTDPEIDPDDIMVPSMIIQPFVENAIWHGLVHKHGKGRLHIHISMRNDRLICVVEDDGIGRKKAMEIRQRKQPLHQSMGLKLTEDRIKLLQEARGYESAHITVVDLEDDGEASGTKVVIELPAEPLF